MISQLPIDDTGGMKLMVANRGEIAVRVFRAARDTDMKSVAIFAEEDRFGGHVTGQQRSEQVLWFRLTG